LDYREITTTTHVWELPHSFGREDKPDSYDLTLPLPDLYQEPNYANERFERGDIIFHFYYISRAAEAYPTVSARHCPIEIYRTIAMRDTETTIRQSDIAKLPKRSSLSKHNFADEMFIL
jgi:hypothetical protein